jgi:hypothetical protein
MSLEAWGDEGDFDDRKDWATEQGWLNPDDLTKALIDVMNERDRQQDVEGFDRAHDDAYTGGELAKAALCYLGTIVFTRDLVSKGRIQPDIRLHQTLKPPAMWPWNSDFWKPKGERRDLIRAAALLLAEIERMDRASKK